MRRKIEVSILSVLLFSTFMVLGFISPQANASISIGDMPILPVVGLMVLSGVIYLILLNYLDDRAMTLEIVLALGLVIRAAMLLSSPIITVDYFRYQWDGAVLANGFNPYLYSPEQILIGEVPDKLVELANHPASTINEVIFQELRTPYPPVSQLFFALSHLVQPWSFTVWRIVLLAFDLLTLVLLLRLLDELDLPELSIAIYWLNPLLVKEIVGSGHMDILIMPFLLAGILLLIRRKHYSAFLFLALSVGVKIWPIVLLPLFLRPILPDRKRAGSALLLFLTLCMLIFYPVYLSRINDSLGIVAYARNWEYNASLFQVILIGSNTLLAILKVHSLSGQHLSRALIAILFSVWSLHVLRDPYDSKDLFHQCTLIISGLLFLSPTFFPWYFVWILPFLVFYPLRPLLLLSSLLPLYYLRFHFFALEQVDFFDGYVVWLQFVPVWGLFFYEWLLRRRNQPGQGADT